jgi:hypothetical protein
MVKEGSVELARYTGLANWVPQVGDMIIKSGWFSRVKWFGIINGVEDDVLHVLTEASPLLLVATPPAILVTNGKSKVLSRHQIVNSFKGTYAVVQQTPKGAVVWYV